MEFPYPNPMHIKHGMVFPALSYELCRSSTRIAYKTSDLATTAGSSQTLTKQVIFWHSAVNFCKKIAAAGAQALPRSWSLPRSWALLEPKPAAVLACIGASWRNAIFRSYKLWLDHYVFSLGCRQPTTKWNPYVTFPFAKLSHSPSTIQLRRDSRIHRSHAYE